MFSMGIVCSVVTQLCTVPYLKDNSDDITVYYNLVLGIITILCIVLGYLFFFEKCPDGNIGSHDKGMGLVLGIVTVPLLLLEIVLIFEIFRTRHINNALGVLLLVWFLEKIIQVIFYVLVRKCIPLREVPEYNNGAIFYLKFLSFVNFTLWLNCIPFAEIKLYDEVSHGESLWLVDGTFKALVIDYRLLSTLLFLEQALVLSHTSVGEPNVHSPVDETFNPPKNRRWYTLFGILVGLLCLLMEILNGIQFWLPESYPDFVNLFPILVDIILVFLGCLLLYHVGVQISHNQNVSLVTLMVSSMGAVSIVYLLIFGFLCIIMIANNSESKVKRHYDYVIWSTVVFFVRGISLSALLVVYAGVPFIIMESSDNQKKKMNYFITWALCEGLFARFIGSVLDEFHGTMHEIAEHYLEPKHLGSLKDLFNIGPLFQLATCLHLALHFLLMILRLHRPPRFRVLLDDGTQKVNASASISDFDRASTSGIVLADGGEDDPGINEKRFSDSDTNRYPLPLVARNLAKAI